MKRFLKSAFLISLGGALPLLSGLVLLIPYTDNLNTSDYGELAIYISFSLLVQYLMNFGIDTYLTVHYFDFNKDDKGSKKFIGSIFGYLILIGVLISIVFLAIGSLLFDFVFREGLITFFPFGFISVITAFFNAFFRTYVNLQILKDKTVKYFLFGLFNFVVTVVISTLLVYQYPNTLIGPIYGRLFSGVLIFILAFVFTINETKILFRKQLLPGFLKFCRPVLIFNLLTWVLVYINNYILNAFETMSAVGIYDFALKCILLIDYSGIGLISTINPRIMQLYKNQNSKSSTAGENKYHHVYSAFNIIFISINIFLIPIIVMLLVSNTEYYSAFNLLPFLCVSFVFRGLYNAFWNPIVFNKKTNVLPRILIIAASIQIISGILLIDNFGIMGGVWSFFMVRPIQAFLMWLESKKIFQFKFNKIKMLLVPIIYCVAVIAIWQLIDTSYLNKSLLQMAIAFLLVIGVYRKEIAEMPVLWNKK